MNLGLGRREKSQVGVGGLGAGRKRSGGCEVLKI
jgi:hypothetical protein